MIRVCGYFNNHNGEGGWGCAYSIQMRGMKELGRVHSKIAHYG